MKHLAPTKKHAARLHLRPAKAAVSSVAARRKGTRVLCGIEVCGVRIADIEVYPRGDVVLFDFGWVYVDEHARWEQSSYAEQSQRRTSPGISRTPKYRRPPKPTFLMRDGVIERVVLRHSPMSYPTMAKCPRPGCARTNILDADQLRVVPGHLPGDAPAIPEALAAVLRTGKVASESILPPLDCRPEPTIKAWLIEFKRTYERVRSERGEDGQRSLLPPWSEFGERLAQAIKQYVATLAIDVLEGLTVLIMLRAVYESVGWANFEGRVRDLAATRGIADLPPQVWSRIEPAVNRYFRTSVELQLRLQTTIASVERAAKPLLDSGHVS